MNRCKYNEIAHNGPYITCPHCRIKVQPGELPSFQTFYCNKDGETCFSFDTDENKK